MADSLSGEPYGAQGAIRRVTQSERLDLRDLVGAGVRHADEDGSVWGTTFPLVQKYWYDFTFIYTYFKIYFHFKSYFFT